MHNSLRGSGLWMAVPSCGSGHGELQQSFRGVEWLDRLHQAPARRPPLVGIAYWLGWICVPVRWA